jgi:hypothetical protein
MKHIRGKIVDAGDCIPVDKRDPMTKYKHGVAVLTTRAEIKGKDIMFKDVVLLRAEDYAAINLRQWRYKGIDGATVCVSGDFRICGTGDAQTDFNIAYFTAKRRALMSHGSADLERVKEWIVEEVA